jgi:hypothetical protein
VEDVRGEPQLDLPHMRPWNERGSVLGNIRGSRSRLLEDLKLLLQIVGGGVNSDQVVSWPGSGTKVAVGSIVGPIYSCGLFYRQGQRIQLSTNGEKWLESHDVEFLIAVLHANVRFVGEILKELLAGPMSHPALLTVAKQKYEFGWTTDNPIHNRTKWLEAAGLVNSYSHKVHISENGRCFLSRIRVHEPIVVTVKAADLDAPPESIATLLRGINSEGLGRSRAASCYIPAAKNNAGQVDAIKAIVASCASPTSDHSLTAETARTF